jgi:hypothetical protein
MNMNGSMCQAGVRGAVRGAGAGAALAAAGARHAPTGPRPGLRLANANPHDPRHRYQALRHALRHAAEGAPRRHLQHPLHQVRFFLYSYTS